MKRELELQLTPPVVAAKPRPLAVLPEADPPEPPPTPEPPSPPEPPPVSLEAFDALFAVVRQGGFGGRARWSRKEHGWQLSRIYAGWENEVVTDEGTGQPRAICRPRQGWPRKP